MLMEPVAGIDVSKDFSDICILSPENAVYQRLKIKHDESGMSEAVSALKKVENKYGKSLVVVMEATSHYHRPLRQFLLQHNLQVITINPLQSSALKNLTIRKIKSDPSDAYRLALAYRTSALKPNIIPDDKIENLRRLTRQHFDITQDITAYMQRLQCIIDQAFPGYRNHFERLNCQTSLAILEKYPSPEALCRARISTIAKIFNSIARRSSDYGIKRASELKNEAKKAIKIRIPMESSAVIIRAYISILRQFQKARDQIDMEVKQIIESDSVLSSTAALLCTIPGVSIHSAAVIIAEIGDFSKFRKAKQLVAFFGMEPSVHQSGKYVGQNNQLSKRGSRFMRLVLHFIVQTNISHMPGKPDMYRNPVIAEYYKRKCETKAKLSVMCALMHKFINIIFAVLRDQKPYEIRQPEEHVRLMLTKCAKSSA